MPRKPQFTTNDVTDAAFKLVRKSGWAGLSASAVAAELGCSTMPIYSHFKNMDKLQDEVVKKAWVLIQKYESKQYTKDAWVDQAVGYVRFAKKEKNLFMCMFDGRNLKLHREMLREHWINLSQLLDGYEAFSGMDKELSMRIRYSRAMLSHGVAVSASMGWSVLLRNNGVLEKYLTTVSQALLKGYRDVTAGDHGGDLNLDKNFKEIIKKLS